MSTYAAIQKSFQLTEEHKKEIESPLSVEDIVTLQGMTGKSLPVLARRWKSQVGLADLLRRRNLHLKIARLCQELERRKG